MLLKMKMSDGATHKMRGRSRSGFSRWQAEQPAKDESAILQTQRNRFAGSGA